MSVKRLFLSSSLIAISIVILLYGCSKQSEESSIDNDPSLISFTSSAGLKGKSLSAILDSVGSWHNQYQEHMLTYIDSLNIPLSRTSVFKEVVIKRSVFFFESKGINTSNMQSYLSLNGENTSMRSIIDAMSLSDEAFLILKDLANSIEAYDELKHEEFLIAMNKLKSQALGLKNKEETIKIGIPISVAAHSFSYWKENAMKWVIKLRTNNKTNSQNFGIVALAAPCKISMPKLGGADVTGAVSGAIGGAVLGPGGSLAGGVLGSSSASLANLSNQIIDCYVDWWPF